MVALGHWIGDLEIDPFNPGHVLYVTGATIWGSDNATAADANQTTNWTVRAQGLEETAVLDLISPPAGAHLISALGDIGGFRHDDLTVSPPAGMFTNPLLNNTTSLDYAEGNPSFIVRVGSAGNNTPHGAYSTDGGTTWTPFAAEPPGSKGSGSVAASADGGSIVWTPQDAAPYFSRDRGATWTACGSLMGNLKVVADRAAANTFYAFGTEDGSVFASTDGGATFEVRAIELPKGKARLSAAPGHAGDLWLALNDNGLYHSTDGGANFARVENIGAAWALGFGKAAPNTTYPAVYLTGKVGGVSGVYRSDDAGAHWVRINDQQHQYGWIGQVVTGDPRVYGRVYLGTNGRGILVADPVG